MTEVTDNATAPEATNEEIRVDTGTTSLLGESESTAPVAELHEGLVDASLLREDLRELNALSKFIKDDKIDINNVVKSLINAEGLIGKRITDADEETLKEIYNKINVPSNIDGYEIKEIEGKEDLSKEFKELAAKYKIPKEAAEGIFSELLEKDLNKDKSLLEAERASIEENKAILEKEFGSALDKRLKAANKVLDLFGTKELKEFLNTSGAANNAEMIKFLASVGTKYASQTNFTSEVEKAVGVTPAEAESQIRQLFKDSEFMSAWYSQTHPKHNEAKAKLEELYIAKNAGK